MMYNKGGATACQLILGAELVVALAMSSSAAPNSSAAKY
jgi:hypothetical protein